MRNIMLNQPLTQSMNQAYIGGVGGHTSEFPITQNNLSTALQQNSKINVMTSQHHATPRSVYNLSFDSDNTLDNNEHDFTIPESVPQTARILSLNQRFNSPQPKDSLLSPNPEGSNKRGFLDIQARFTKNSRETKRVSIQDLVFS
eukprot:403342423